MFSGGVPGLLFCRFGPRCARVAVDLGSIVQPYYIDSCFFWRRVFVWVRARGARLRGGASGRGYHFWCLNRNCLKTKLAFLGLGRGYGREQLGSSILLAPTFEILHIWIAALRYPAAASYK